MAHLIVGNEDCSYYAVAAPFETAVAKPNLRKNWVELGKKLNVAIYDLNQLSEEVRRKDINDSEALIAVLVHWRNKNAGNAKLENLIKVVESMSLLEISATLRKTFRLENTPRSVPDDTVGSNNRAPTTNGIVVEPNTNEFDLLYETIFTKTSWLGINPWKDLGEALRVNDDKLEDMRLNIMHDKTKTKDVVKEILKIWINQEGHNATVQAIIEKLLKMKWKNTADELTVAFKL